MRERSGVGESTIGRMNLRNGLRTKAVRPLSATRSVGWCLIRGHDGPHRGEFIHLYPVHGHGGDNEGDGLGGQRHGPRAVPLLPRGHCGGDERRRARRRRSAPRSSCSDLKLEELLTGCEASILAESDGPPSLAVRGDCEVRPDEGEVH